MQREIIENEHEVKARYLKGEAAKEELLSLTQRAFEKEKNLLEKWDAKIKPRRLSFLYGRNWKKVNEKAGLKF